jgi:hypothetical protein
VVHGGFSLQIPAGFRGEWRVRGAVFVPFDEVGVHVPLARAA